MTDTVKGTLEQEIDQLTEELYGKLPTNIPDIPCPIDALTKDQQEQLYNLKDSIVNSTDNWYAKVLPNKEVESIMNNPMTYYRYCVGFEWKMDMVAEKLKALIEWRLKEKPGEMTLKDLKHQGPTRLLQCYGYDRQFRPIIYANMNNLDKDKNWDSEENLLLKFKYFVYITERSVERMSLINPNIYQAIWIIDMDNCSLGLGVVKKVKDMFLQLGEYNAERLSSAIILNTSWTLSLVWNFIKLFLTDNVVQRYKLIRKGDAQQDKIIGELIDANANGGTLLSQYGGPVQDPWNIDKIYKLEELKKQLRDLESS